MSEKPKYNHFQPVKNKEGQRENIWMLVCADCKKKGTLRKIGDLYFCEEHFKERKMGVIK